MSVMEVRTDQDLRRSTLRVRKLPCCAFVFVLAVELILLAFSNYVQLPPNLISSSHFVRWHAADWKRKPEHFHTYQ
ncbi:hypothetical protein RCCGEPOP_28584 [Rhizobium sp. Pop5]|nr:hypothetical protein RCCGEPOP_28584 [Rhizobium sp. Pop5]